jgi:hypothetical protein
VPAELRITSSAAQITSYHVQPFGAVFTVVFLRACATTVLLPCDCCQACNTAQQPQYNQHNTSLMQSYATHAHVAACYRHVCWRYDFCVIQPQARVIRCSQQATADLDGSRPCYE